MSDERRATSGERRAESDEQVSDEQVSDEQVSDEQVSDERTATSGQPRADSHERTAAGAQSESYCVQPRASYPDAVNLSRWSAPSLRVL